MLGSGGAALSNANVAAADALNALIVATPEKALAAADAVDAARAAGKPLGKMAGVPIGMKDLFATRGVQTTAGSHILEGFVPEYESTVSRKLWDAGAGMLGESYRDGWLCFERVDGHDRRRLAIAEAPPTLETLPDDRLDVLRAAAIPAHRTGTT